MSQPIRLAIIGMGGFAGDHHRAAHALEKQGECRVVCACDPDPDAFQEAREKLEFSARGIAVYTDYLQMLGAHSQELDMVTIPTPIPLHAPMHRAVIEHGLGCYLEKPPTLDYAELNDMLEVEAGAKIPTQVGFNFIIEAERHTLKRRLLDGEFGAVKRVGFLGMAPRSTLYFNRSPWAGRLTMNGRMVLDSVIGNALSHYLHNLLFWAGSAEILSWAEPASVQAEMYRAHDIENLDTLFAKGMCSNGVEVRLAATHACVGEYVNHEWIECEQATISHHTWQPYEILWRNGRQETQPTTSDDLLQANFRYYFGVLRGEHARPLTRLRDTRPFVEFYDLAYVAAKRITPIPGRFCARSQTPDGKGEYVAVESIREACDTFLASGAFPSRQGIAWAQQGGSASREDLSRFHQVIERILDTA